MVRILIGNVETLRPERVPAEAFERIQRTLDAAPAGVDFHCSQCGALRTATFDPGLLVGNRMTCQNAAGQPACDRLPTPAGPRDPPTYRPGSLVFVRGVPELGDADWPAIVEDDPYERQFFMIKTKGSGGREVPMAYWVTLVPVKKEPRQYRGGFIKAENLIPFMPIQPPPDSTEDYKSALGQATIAFHFNLENRLRMLSFVVNAAFLSSQPPAEPSGAEPAAEAGPSGAGSSQAGPSGVGSAQAGPSEVASSQAGPSGVASSQAGPSGVASSQSGPSEDEPPQDAEGPGLRRRSARIAALKAKLAAQQAAKPSPDSGTSQARASRARSSRRGSGSGTSGAKSSESAASGAKTPSGGKSRAGSSRGRDSRGGSSQERDARERLLAGEYLFRQYWQDLMIAAQYLYPGGINVEDEALAQARLRSMYPHLYHREGYPPVILQLADWGPWFNNFLASFPPETGTYAYGDVPPGASRFGFPGPRREDLVRFLQGYLTGAGTATAAGEPRRTDTGYLHEVLRDYERRRQQEAAAPRVEDPSSEEEDIVPPGPPPELRPGESILSPEYLMRVVSAYEEKVRQHNAALRARTSGAGTSGRGGSGERRPGPSAEDEEEARKRSRH